MNAATAQLDPGQLVSLLGQQRDLYRRLRELSDKQRTMISGDRPELLLNILRDRQDLVTALARLNDDLAPYRRMWDALYTALPEADRAQASASLQEINELLRVILQTDHEDSALLSARKQAIASEIAETSGGQAANRAYAQQSSAQRSARSADITG